MNFFSEKTFLRYKVNVCKIVMFEICFLLGNHEQGAIRKIEYMLISDIFSNAHYSSSLHDVDYDGSLPMNGGDGGCETRRDRILRRRRRALYERRQAAYANADRVIDTSEHDPVDVAKEIVGWMRAES